MIVLVVFVVCAFVLCLLSFVVAVISFFLKKKGIRNISLVVFLITFCFNIYFSTVIGKKILSHFFSYAKSIHSVENGYESVFGKPSTQCISIYFIQKPEIPIMDFSIVIYNQTCAEEIKRVLSLKNYVFKKSNLLELKNISTGYNLTAIFDTIDFKEPINKYEFFEESYNFYCCIFVNADSTKMFYYDLE